MSNTPPDPAFTFAFIIKESFASSRGGVTVISEENCMWIPSIKMKVMLRTPSGRILESSASLVFTTPNYNHIISLHLHDVTKVDVPAQTEIFVRMKRTPQEQQEAFAALDKMMGASWSNIQRFPEFPDSKDFQLWIKQKLSEGLAEEVAIKKPHRQNKSGEHWYKNKLTNKVWRYLETILPTNESFEILENYTEIDKIHITSQPSESSDDGINNLSIKVWINDRLAFEHDYFLDIDSFFTALDAKEGIVSFIGGCGIRECCAMGFPTLADQRTWHWDVFQFTWSSIYEIAKAIISRIELLPTETWEYDFFKERLATYRLTAESIAPNDFNETEDSIY